MKRKKVRERENKRESGMFECIEGIFILMKKIGGII